MMDTPARFPATVKEGGTWIVVPPSVFLSSVLGLKAREDPK